MRHMLVGGFRYTERVRECRKKGYPISVVQIGRGHFHYFLGVPNPPEEKAAPTSLSAPSPSAPELITARRVGNLVREEPSR